MDEQLQPPELTPGQRRRIAHLVAAFEHLDAASYGAHVRRAEIQDALLEHRMILRRAKASLGDDNLLAGLAGEGFQGWDRDTALRHANTSAQAIEDLSRRLAIMEQGVHSGAEPLSPGQLRPLLSELRARVPEHFGKMFPSGVKPARQWQPPSGLPAAAALPAPATLLQGPRTAVKRVMRSKPRQPTAAEAARYAEHVESRSEASPFPTLPGPGRGVP